MYFVRPLLNIVVVFVVVVAAVFTHFALSGYWQTCGRNHNHLPGLCTVVNIQPGSEDFETLSNGLTFISSGMRSKVVAQASQAFWRRRDTKGQIYVMNLGDVSAGARELTIVPSPEFKADTFSPHGISVWEDTATGRHIVFVVNHPFTELASSDRVEKFFFDPQDNKLVHQRTVTHPTMRDVNDVQATGANSFYFTNTKYFSHPSMVFIEMSLSLPLTNIVHCQLTSWGRSAKTNCSEVDSELAGSNGVAMSHDGKSVYVAAMISRDIVVYTRNPDDNSLTRKQVYPVYAYPDNIQVDRTTGDLYVAVHPDPTRFFQYTDDLGNRTSPSQVLRLTWAEGRIVSSQELLYDEGDLISAASTALLHNDTLLVGSVFHSLLACRLAVPLL